MKIRSVTLNNRKKAFEVNTARQRFFFPYVKAVPRPMASDPVIRVILDDELGREGFTYTLEFGREGTVHIGQVLEYNRDPRYMRDLLLYLGCSP